MTIANTLSSKNTTCVEKQKTCRDEDHREEEGID